MISGYFTRAAVARFQITAAGAVRRAMTRRWVGGRRHLSDTGGGGSKGSNPPPGGQEWSYLKEQFSRLVSLFRRTAARSRANDKSRLETMRNSKWSWVRWLVREKTVLGRVGSILFGMAFIELSGPMYNAAILAKKSGSLLPRELGERAMEPIDEELLYVLSLVPNQNNATPSELLDDILKNGITWPKIDPKSDAYDQEPGEEALLTLPAREARERVECVVDRCLDHWTQLSYDASLDALKSRNFAKEVKEFRERLATIRSNPEERDNNFHKLIKFRDKWTQKPLDDPRGQTDEAVVLLEDYISVLTRARNGVKMTQSVETDLYSLGFLGHGLSLYLLSHGILRLVYGIIPSA